MCVASSLRKVDDGVRSAGDGRNAMRPLSEDAPVPVAPCLELHLLSRNVFSVEGMDERRLLLRTVISILANAVFCPIQTDALLTNKMQPYMPNSPSLL